MKEKLKKPLTKKIIAAAIAALTLLLIYRVALNLLLPEKYLKNAISGFFKENLDKAVKFESMRFDFFGNIEVRDFNLSVSSDFNDNISLVKSRKFLIRLDLWKLLKNETLVKSITFNDAEITIFKKYFIFFIKHL